MSESGEKSSFHLLMVGGAILGSFGWFYISKKATYFFQALEVSTNAFRPAPRLSLLARRQYQPLC